MVREIALCSALLFAIEANAGVHKCVGTNGKITFTDKGCPEGQDAPVGGGLGYVTDEGSRADYQNGRRIDAQNAQRAERAQAMQQQLSEQPGNIRDSFESPRHEEARRLEMQAQHAEDNHQNREAARLRENASRMRQGLPLQDQPAETRVFVQQPQQDNSPKFNPQSGQWCQTHGGIVECH